MNPATRNAQRARAVAVSRQFKELFGGAVGRAAAWLRPVTGWCYRRVFLAPSSSMRGWVLKRAAEHVLADLRDFSFARTSAFDPEPVIMARRQGRRDVWLRISNYLNLDEAVVQKLMEIDDGIE